jgi:hypothetical protein
MTIIRNAARCLRCNDEIESRHRRDFRECRCGDIFVDGGREYLRRGWKGPGFEELSVHEGSAA